VVDHHDRGADDPGAVAQAAARATFLYNPNMAASAVNMARLIALGQGFPELSPPEVPRQIIVPAAVVTQENVDKYEKYAFN
jgi:ribose transport system substrate-binding protein